MPDSSRDMELECFMQSCWGLSSSRDLKSSGEFTGSGSNGGWCPEKAGGPVSFSTLFLPLISLLLPD